MANGGYEALLGIIWMLAFYEFIRRMPQDDQRMIQLVDNISQTLFSLRFSSQTTMANYPQQHRGYEALLGFIWMLAFYELIRWMPQDDDQRMIQPVDTDTSFVSGTIAPPNTKIKQESNFQSIRDKIPSAFKLQSCGSYAKGACQNCGDMGHDKKSCFERPKAKYSAGSLAIEKKVETKRSSSIYGSTSLSKPQLVSSRANKTASYLLKEEPKPESESFCSAQDRSAWDHPPIGVQAEKTESSRKSRGKAKREREKREREDREK